ncbi:hypothetical protein HDU76_011454, partial [Blyttiomyces sp. JEL0837]
YCGHCKLTNAGASGNPATGDIRTSSVVCGLLGCKRKTKLHIALNEHNPSLAAAYNAALTHLTNIRLDQQQFTQQSSTTLDPPSSSSNTQPSTPTRQQPQSPLPALTPLKRPAATESTITSNKRQGTGKHSFLPKSTTTKTENESFLSKSTRAEFKSFKELYEELKDTPRFLAIKASISKSRQDPQQQQKTSTTSTSTSAQQQQDNSNNQQHIDDNQLQHPMYNNQQQQTTMPNQSNNPFESFTNMIDHMNERITALENSFSAISVKQDHTIQKMQQMTTEFMSDQRKINKEHENRIREAQQQYKQLAAQLTLTTDKLTAASITSTEQSRSLEKKMEKVLEELVKVRPRLEHEQFPALQPSTARPPTLFATLRALKDNKELTPEQEAVLTFGPDRRDKTIINNAEN